MAPIFFSFYFIFFLLETRKHGHEIIFVRTMHTQEASYNNLRCGTNALLPIAFYIFTHVRQSAYTYISNDSNRNTTQPKSHIPTAWARAFARYLNDR